MIRSDKETEKIVENMLREGKSYREIMAKVHVAPNRIKLIKNKLTGESSRAPKFTQAYRLFSQGESRFDVAEKLEMREKEARECHIEYYKLKRADTLSRLYRTQKPDFIAKVERVVQTLDRHGIVPTQYDDYIKMAKRMPVLVSEENTLRDSRLKHESENKILMKQKNELKFEIAKLGASHVCIEAARDALIQQNELLINTKCRLESDINILRKKRTSQRAAFLRATLKLSETDFKKETENLVENCIPSIIEEFKLYVEKKNGFIHEDDLLNDRLDLEQMLRNGLNEPVEDQVKWMTELLTEDLYEQNGYHITSL
jgi:hypothetical protein